MSDVAVQNKANTSIADITTGAGFYTSLATGSRAEKMALLRVINNSTPLLDVAGKDIAVVDIVMQSVEIANDTTGELEDAIRITLVDSDGAAYHATSKGIAQSLKQAFNVIGTPDTWEEPLVVTPVEEKGRNGYRYLTLKF